MKTPRLAPLAFLAVVATALPNVASAETHVETAASTKRIMFHDVRTDAQGAILPWYSQDLGASYDHVIRLTWKFWISMEPDVNGIPYYMNHQVWMREYPDRRGLGGDQLSMALSSFGLLYAYLGDEAVKEHMKFIADHYLTRSLSPDNASWPGIPYPYNTLVYSGVYDGDMILGKGYTQPDKAGSFGWELVKLYEMTQNEAYLQAATKIADTLAAKMQQGDRDRSPLPFKVSALTGEVGKLRDNEVDQADTSLFANRPVIGEASYTTNYAGTLELFLALQRIKSGNVDAYAAAFDRLLGWMKEYPLKNNRWGPFFEDIPGWSDTQINAVTFARFMMEHRELFPEWKTQVRGILDWVYAALGNEEWKPLGVTVVNEQTAYRVPGNSHTSRQAAAELLYAELTGEQTWRTNAIRQLSWATYMVNVDGTNQYPRDDVWLTDGYGDYIRHYLNAMASAPELAPAHRDHLLRSTSRLEFVEYAPKYNRFGVISIPPALLPRTLVHYRTFSREGTETLRLTRRPHEVLVGGKRIEERSDSSGEGWTWKPLERGGILTVRHINNKQVVVLSAPL